MAATDSNVNPSASPEDSTAGDGPTSGSTREDQVRAVLSSFGLGIGEIILLGIWTLIFGGIYYLAAGGIPQSVSLLLENLGLAFGTATLAIIYFRYTDHDTSFIDLRKPSLAELGIGLGSALVLLAASLGIEQGFGLLGIQGSEHAIYKLATSESSNISPSFFLLYIPISILIIGPAEEFAYRNIIQKRLYDAFTKPQAILVTSLVFASIHLPAYLTSTLGAAAITLTTVLALSLVLGYIYAKTENLVVPAIAHGVYNAILFASLYIQLTA